MSVPHRLTRLLVYTTVIRYADQPAVSAAAAAPLVVPPVANTTPPGEPATGNVMADASVPAGSTASVTGFLVPGSSTPIKAGSGAVPVVDPTTGTVTGTIDVKPDGSYTFTPTPGYTGPVPSVTLNVASTDGQSVQVPLSLSVSALLRDGSESPSVVQGSGPVRLNVLTNAVVPSGSSVRVTSFVLPGSTTVYQAGPTPVTVRDPVTNTVAGTVVLLANGTATFTLAPGFTGQAPAIQYTVASSDGQVSPGTLSVVVQPGMAVLLTVQHGWGANRHLCWACYAADLRCGCDTTVLALRLCCACCAS